MIRLFKVFGDNSCVRSRSHEIRVTSPAWDNVEVYVLFDPGSCSLSDIRADVEAIDMIGFPQNNQRLLCEQHQLSEDFTREDLKRIDVCVGDDHEMTVGIRIAVQDDKGMLAAVQDEVFRAVLLFYEGAKQAAIVLGIFQDVFHAPGCPEMLHV